MGDYVKYRFIEELIGTGIAILTIIIALIYYYIKDKKRWK